MTMTLLWETTLVIVKFTTKNDSVMLLTFTKGNLFGCSVYDICKQW